MPLPSFATPDPINLFPTGYWGPLVSCTGNYDPSNPSPTGQPTCISFCDLIHTFLHVIYFGMSIALFVLAPIFFAWGGIMILIAGGDPGKMQSGKKILTGTLVGIGITLGAFLIVATFVRFLGVSSFIPGFDSSGAFTCSVQPNPNP